MERRCETIRCVDVCIRIQRGSDGRNVTLLGSVVNGRRLGCHRDQTEAYEQQHSSAHRLPPPTETPAWETETPALEATAGWVTLGSAPEGEMSRKAPEIFPKSAETITFGGFVFLEK